MIKFENIEVSGFGAAFRGLRNPLESWHKSDSFFGIINAGYSDQDYEVTEKWIRKKEPEIEEFSDTYEELFGKYNKWLLEQGILRRNEDYDVYDYAFIGPNDMQLAQRMIKAGDDEAKFMRMIHVQMDITAPLYWWKEFDTYKVGTVANSCSTMHKIAAKKFTMEDFSCEHLTSRAKDKFEDIIDELNHYRDLYLNGGDDYWTDSDDEDYEPKDKRMWWQMIQLLPSSYNQKRTVDFNYQTARHMSLAREHHKLSEWSVDFCNMTKELPYGKELIWIKKENK